MFFFLKFQVTGADEGIGFEIVKYLADNVEDDLYLTAKDTEKGMKAVEELKKVKNIRILAIVYWVNEFSKYFLS